VEIFPCRDGHETVLARLGKGEFFGEMSVLESLPRDASARSNGPSALLGLGPGALLLRLRQDPSLALEMLHALSGRIRALNARVSGS
jgi:CRP-like cAMP-binding protein